MNKKCITACFLLAALLISLCACGSKSVQLPDGTYLLSNKHSVKPGEPSAALDPKTVYDSLTYIPEMFYGTYVMPSDEETLTNYLENSDYIDMSGSSYSQLPAIPCGIHAFVSKTAADTGIYPMTLTFRTVDGIPVTKDCTYTIEDGKLKCRFVKNYTRDSSNDITGCTYTGTELEYGFEFSGTKLTLSYGEKSVELISEMFAKDPPSFYLNCFSSSDHEAFENIRSLEFGWSGTAQTRLYLTDVQNNTYTTASATMSEDGLFTLTLPGKGGNITKQYVYFFAAQDSLVLTDGTNVYTFNSNWFDEYKKGLVENLTPEEAGKLKDLSREELEAVIAKKSSLIEDISKAFAEIGINIDVNKTTGEIAMDSAVLFGGDSADVSDEGKALLNKLVKVYTDVIFTDEYKDFISGITIAGHTAPVANVTYEEALPLSKQRAVNVKNYCTSAATGLDTNTLAQLSKVMDAVGKSSSMPVKNKDGTIDLAASRRVTFHLVINISGAAAPEETTEKK